MGLIDGGVFEAAMAEIRRRSQLSIYQTDFDAWAWDVLRLRNYEKMRKIAWDALFAPIERTLVKSGNGTGKSVLEAEMILWAGSVFPVGETVSIISAPSIPQLQKVTFAYLKSFHGRVSTHLRPEDFQIPGRIDENLGWVSETPSGKVWLASGRKPPDQDAVSMFQGLRSQFGMTYVWFDEAGGMGRAMYTAAEAVMTGDLARFFGIGNPDNAGTDFQQNFIDREKSREFNLHTISVYDTPIFTGERVYPHTDEGDRLEMQMRRALTSKRWVAHKSRIWATGGEIVPDYEHMDPNDPLQPDPRYFRRVDKQITEPLEPGKVEQLGREVITLDGTKHVVMGTDPVKWDARGLSKVLGEFPGDSDFAFFPQAVITLAHEATIPEDDDVRPILGVDIARFGPDESVIFVNRGGRCRILDSWARTDTVESARRIHRTAQDIGAAEVRIDATGVGGGVYDMLRQLEEFADKTYLLIGVDGAKRSPDPRRWANSRAYNHDQLRTKMALEEIDLDYDDRELADQLLNVTFKFTNVQGAIQITPKDEMRTEMNGSPDRLDALIYSVIDTSAVLADPAAIQPGDTILLDPWELLAAHRAEMDLI
jgi:hypothetical protein